MNADIIIESLPSSPLAALYTALKRMDREIEWNADRDCYETIIPYATLIEWLAIVITLSKKANRNFEPPKLSGSEERQIGVIAVYITIHYGEIGSIYSEINTAKMLDSALEHYSIILEDGFCYEFSDGDIDKIQNTISELRDAIRKSTLFTENHKSRLLAKLEKLQAELHKKMSSLDCFWGIFSETGIMLGKFGNDAKPFVDRINEITGTAWRSQARAEELPSDAPLSLVGCRDKEIEE